MSKSGIWKVVDWCDDKSARIGVPMILQYFFVLPVAILFGLGKLAVLGGMMAVLGIVVLLPCALVASAVRLYSRMFEKRER